MLLYFILFTSHSFSQNSKPGYYQFFRGQLLDVEVANNLQDYRYIQITIKINGADYILIYCPRALKEQNFQNCPITLTEGDFNRMLSVLLTAQSNGRDISVYIGDNIYYDEQNRASFEAIKIHTN